MDFSNYKASKGLGESLLDEANRGETDYSGASPEFQALMGLMRQVNRKNAQANQEPDMLDTLKANAAEKIKAQKAAAQAQLDSQASMKSAKKNQSDLRKAIDGRKIDNYLNANSGDGSKKGILEVDPNMKAVKGFVSGIKSNPEEFKKILVKTFGVDQKKVDELVNLFKAVI